MGALTFGVPWFRRRLLLILIAGLVLGLGGLPLQAQSAQESASAVGSSSTGYHLNIRGGFEHLASFPVPNADQATVIGSQTANIYGIDSDGETVWALNQDTLQIGTLDVATAAFSATATVTGLPTGHNMTGLAVHPNGLLYMSSSNSTLSTLYNINPLTGVVSPLGDITGAPVVIAIAINCEGEMYAHDVSLDSLIYVPQNPNEATIIGPTGQNANFAQGMDFDNATGTLYGWLYRGGGAGDFVSFNTETGAATAIAPLNGEFEGFIESSCGPQITSPAPSDGNYGLYYAHTFTADGDVVDWELNGTLPPGLSFMPDPPMIMGTPSAVGTYPDITITATDSNGRSGSATYTITIGKGILYAQADNQTRAYGQPNPAFTIGYQGFAFDDTIADIDTPPTASTTATLTTPVGSYAISLSPGEDNNYTIGTISGTLTITKADQTIDFAPLPSLTYGDAPLTVAATATSGLEVDLSASGACALDGVTLSILSAGTCMLFAEQPGDGNHNPVSASQEYSVAKAALTARPNDASRTVGQPNPAFTIAYAGFVLGDTVADLDTAPTASSVADETSPAGEYPIIASGGLDDNYAFAYEPGTLSVVQDLWRVYIPLVTRP